VNNKTRHTPHDSVAQQLCPSRLTSSLNGLTACELLKQLQFLPVTTNYQQQHVFGRNLSSRRRIGGVNCNKSAINSSTVSLPKFSRIDAVREFQLICDSLKLKSPRTSYQRQHCGWSWTFTASGPGVLLYDIAGTSFFSNVILLIPAETEINIPCKAVTDTI